MQVIQANVEDTFQLLQGLMEEHYEEVPFGEDKLEFELNYELYRQLHKAGLLLNLLLMEELGGKDTVIGYMIAIASPMPHHYGHMEVRTDSFYVAPEFRKLGGFDMLLDKLHELCTDQSITAVQVIANENFKGASAILGAKGYKLTERVFTKED
jgi:GNAT superfamily N-acetyltransferase